MTFLLRPHTLLSHNDSLGFPGFPNSSLYHKDPLTVSHRKPNSKCFRQYRNCLFHKTGSWGRMAAGQLREWLHHFIRHPGTVCFALLGVGLLLRCYSPPHDDKVAAEAPAITSSHDISGGWRGALALCGSVSKIRKMFASNATLFSSTQARARPHSSVNSR